MPSSFSSVSMRLSPVGEKVTGWLGVGLVSDGKGCAGLGASGSTFCAGAGVDLGSYSPEEQRAASSRSLSR